MATIREKVLESLGQSNPYRGTFLPGTAPSVGKIGMAADWDMRNRAQQLSEALNLVEPGDLSSFFTIDNPLSGAVQGSMNRYGGRVGMPLFTSAIGRQDQLNDQTAISKLMQTLQTQAQGEQFGAIQPFIQALGESPGTFGGMVGDVYKGFTDASQSVLESKASEESRSRIKSSLSSLGISNPDEITEFLSNPSTSKLGISMLESALFKPEGLTEKEMAEVGKLKAETDRIQADRERIKADTERTKADTLAKEQKGQEENDDQAFFKRILDTYKADPMFTGDVDDWLKMNYPEARERFRSILSGMDPNILAEAEGPRVGQQLLTQAGSYTGAIKNEMMAPSGSSVLRWLVNQHNKDTGFNTTEEDWRTALNVSMRYKNEQQAMINNIASSLPAGVKEALATLYNDKYRTAWDLDDWAKAYQNNWKYPRTPKGGGKAWALTKN